MYTLQYCTHIARFHNALLIGVMVAWPLYIRQLPHQEFWLEVKSLVADGVSYTRAQATAGKGDYTKIEDSNTATGPDSAAKSDENKPTDAAQPSEAPNKGHARTLLAEMRDANVHSSQQKIKVVVNTATSSQEQMQAEHTESEDDDELVE